ncbi:VWA domain-containing protein [bacterium]|nr:VWA domain-containing protein [bacterium]
MIQTIKKIAILSFAVMAAGCSPDYQVTNTKEVRVVVDSFLQPSQIEELDVLVVLDTSGSMSDNYDDVADGMDILRSDIESLTLDYQFGYITMDPQEISYLGPFDHTASTIDMLMAPSLLPVTSLEEGFAATYEFLNSEDGYMFRRPNADFLLFLISDEDEQSAISSSIFYEWLHEELVDVKHDTVAVANPEGDATNSWANEIGYKYIELAHLYNKDILDIKSEDWSVWLSDSSYLTQHKDYIALSEPDPILESIVVYVDQTIVYDWIYIEETNIVHLSFIPDYSSVIEVGYNVYVQ